MSNNPIPKSFDYIVIGGGTAGCVIARRLAEDPSVSVCLVEAGPSDEGNDKILQLSRWSELLDSEYDYRYTITHQPRGNSNILHSRAKCLGGCSSHNSAIAFLAPDLDFTEWVSLGCRGWEPENVQKFYGKVREKITITPVREEDNALNKAFVDAGRNAGFPQIEFNTPEYQRNFSDCVGYLQVNANGPIRSSASVGYLHPIASLPKNLTVLTGVRVKRILLDNSNRAVGIETEIGVILSNEEMILCAGAFDSPRLLLLSGIGPSWHLREVGVQCKVHLPGVGSHLIDHPEGVIIWEINRPIPPKIRQKYEAALFATTQEGSTSPDLMFHFGLEAFDMQTVPKGYPTASNAISLTPNVTKAKSEGTVRLRSSDPSEPPLIDFKYFTDPDGHDEAVMIEGIKLARKIANTEPLKDWIQQELAPGPSVQTDREISDYVRKTANTVYHPAGTCKMGDPSKDKQAVVDSQLRVVGVKGLRVADASVFPTMPTINPCITVMMIGEKCAEMVKEDRVKSKGTKSRL
ncbi:uncharacterized protein VTP21DRAFT_8030 [Calcarisporiella thermophila]|uniref:uncharacterized protein n=1 Tax=Calcarisporiella thermophila TaxID=911321 RepID=UPI003743A600